MSAVRRPGRAGRTGSAAGGRGRCGSPRCRAPSSDRSGTAACSRPGRCWPGCCSCCSSDRRWPARPRRRARGHGASATSPARVRGGNWSSRRSRPVRGSASAPYVPPGPRHQHTERHSSTLPTPDPSASTITARERLCREVAGRKSRTGHRNRLLVPGVRAPGGAVPLVVELRQLRYFLAVAEEGRFSRAARRLHIAAPSLSQQVQALERELRVPLFERTPQRVELTLAGQALVERARVILAEVDRARAEVRAAGTGRERLTLRVANMADLVLGAALRSLAGGIDGVEVSVSSSRGDDALEAVRQARADAAVVWSRRPTDRDLDGVVLGTVLFGVVVPRGHRAAPSGGGPARSAPRA